MRHFIMLVLAASAVQLGCQDQDGGRDDAEVDTVEEVDAHAGDVTVEDEPGADDAVDGPADDPLDDGGDEDVEEETDAGFDPPCRSGLEYPAGPYIRTLPDSPYDPVPGPLASYAFQGYFDDDGDGEIADETWRTVTMDEMLNSCFKHLLIMVATPDCPYCGVELAELVEMYSRLRTSGFLVLVLVADRHEPDQSFIDTYVSYHGLTMPVGADPGREVVSIFPHGFSSMTPKNILIDLETMQVGQCCQDGDPGTPGRISCWLEGYSSLMLDCIEREHMDWVGG